MIRALRLTMGTNLSFSNIQIYEKHERGAIPNFFEDANFVFISQDGVRSAPYYNIAIIELDNIQRRISPSDGISLARISISFDLSYGPVMVIPHTLYDKHKIPVILPITDQFVFTTKEGTYITSDYQINFTHFKNSTWK